MILKCRIYFSEFVQEVLRDGDIFAGLHKPVIRGFRYGGRFITDTPDPQQMQIIPQKKNAERCRLSVRFCIACYRIGVRGRRVIDSKICSDSLRGIIAADAEHPGNKVDHVPMGMTPKAIEMPIQLQTGIVIFMKGTVGHAVASYIQSIHLRRIQCGNSILDSFVYGHVIPFHLIFAFSFSSAIIITAPGGGHGAGRLW